MAIVAAVTAVLLFLTNFRGRVPVWLFYTGDSGLWIDEAKRVIGGAVLYRDVFEFVGPGVVYWNALMLRVFGARPESLAIGVILVGVALALLMYRLTLRGSSRGAAFVAAFLFVTLVYVNYSRGNHKWLALIFILSGAELLAREARTAWSVFAAGMLFGAAVLCTQDLAGGAALGAFLAVALEAARRRAPVRELALLAGGGVLAAALGLSYFVAQAGLGTVWYDTVVFPLTRYREVNSFSLQLAFYAGLTRLPRTVGHLLMIAGCLVLAFRALRSGQRWALVVAATGLGMALPAIPTRGLEPPLFALQCAPLIPLFAGWLTRPARLQRVVAFFVIVAGIVSAGAAWRTPLVKQECRAGTVFVRAPMAGVEWIERNVPRGGAAFAFPLQGGTYFLSDTRNVTSFGFLEDAHFTTPEQMRQVIGELRARRPAAGVWSDIGLTTLDVRTSTLWPVYREIEGMYAVREARRELVLFR